MGNFVLNGSPELPVSAGSEFSFSQDEVIGMAQRPQGAASGRAHRLLGAVSVNHVPLSVGHVSLGSRNPCLHAGMHTDGTKGTTSASCLPPGRAYRLLGAVSVGHVPLSVGHVPRIPKPMHTDGTEGATSASCLPPARRKIVRRHVCMPLVLAAPAAFAPLPLLGKRLRARVACAPSAGSGRSGRAAGTDLNRAAAKNRKKAARKPCCAHSA